MDTITSNPELASGILLPSMRVAGRVNLRAEAKRPTAPHVVAFERGCVCAGDKQFEQALGLFDEALRLKPDYAPALFNKGCMLGALGRNADAILVYDDLLARFGEAAEATLRLPVAKALFNKGCTLITLGRREDAIAIYDALLARFDTVAEPLLRVLVAESLYNKGCMLGTLGRNEAAITVYDNLLARFGNATELRLRELVARALVNKGASFAEHGRHEASIAAYDDLLARRFGKAVTSPLRVPFAEALFNKGNALSELGRHEDAIVAYDDLLNHVGAADDLLLQILVATTQFNKGVSLNKLVRHEDAVTSYDNLLAHFGEAVELQLREVVAISLGNKGGTLGLLGRHKDAIGVYDDLLTRSDVASDSLRESFAGALIGKGVSLGATGHHESAIAVFDDMLARFGSETSSKQVARAQVNKGLSLGALGRNVEALAAFRKARELELDAEEQQEVDALIEDCINKGGVADEQNKHYTEADLSGITELQPARAEKDFYPMLRGGFKQAQGEATAPAVARVLEWPTEKWKGSPEELSRKKFALFPFLRRVWVNQFIEKTGVLVTMPMLLARDREAGLALKGARRNGRQMHDDIPIYSGKELKELAAAGRPLLVRSSVLSMSGML